MYCHSCGIELPEHFRYCSQCGATTGVGGFASRSQNSGRVLTRPREGRKIAGVCAGLARYLGIDVTLVRIAMVVMVLWPLFLGPILYIVCWIVMPREPLLAPPAHAQTVNAT